MEEVLCIIVGAVAVFSVAIGATWLLNKDYWQGYRNTKFLDKLKELEEQEREIDKYEP